MASVREWKPGDVAMTAKNTVALCGNSGRFIDQGGAPWSDDRFPENLRPLVVIDPEDREQVERLVEELCEGQWGHRWGREQVDKMQAALRAFANPTPPIEEPTGLGAVVEDASQVEHVHLGGGLWAYGTTDGPSQGFRFADINAVRVLSEGIPAEADR